ncbi:MAG: S8 family serine peptidase [Xanthobacteraceae bacterium]
MAIRKCNRTIRVAGAMIVALVAAIIGTTRDAHAQFATPIVSSISPTNGPPAGGTNVTITGSNFFNGATVNFGGDSVGSAFVNGSTLTATSPAGTGTVAVTVTSRGGTSTTSVAFTYAPGGSTTSLSSSPNPSSLGQTVTFTANVTGLAPTGTVNFFDGGTQIGRQTLAGGTASLTTSSLAVGTHSITARYGGDPNNAASASAVLTQNVAPVGSTTSLSSSPNPSSHNQSVTFTATVTGLSPTGAVIFFVDGTQIGSQSLAGGTASIATSSLTVGTHAITARYGGDTNNNASTSAVLTQSVNVPADSIKLRALQVSATPIIAQISGQAISGAIDSAIDAGFSDNPPAVTPNGGGFTVNIPLDQPPSEVAVRVEPGVAGRGGANVTNLPNSRRNGGGGPASLANGRWGGNGAPPGVRLIDMGAIPLPPSSGVPPDGEARFVPNQVVLQFGGGTTPQQIAAIAQRFGLTIVAQANVGALGRTIYTFQIGNGRSVREVIRLIGNARLNAAAQPNYTYGLTQAQDAAAADQGDPAQYIVPKLQLVATHRISNGDDVVIALIDSRVDSKQPAFASRIIDDFDAGCGAAEPPNAHGTGMAGAIASHVGLLGVAPKAKIIAICAFGGAGKPQSTSVNIVRGLDYAISHGAKIVNMSFAGPRDPALAQELQIAREKGILILAAAGNNGPKSPPLYPGADPNVMAVTATDENDHLFRGANQGKYVAIAAPGVNILVPAPDGNLQLTTGTSVATAIASGVAALLIARKPSLTPEQIRAILVTTAAHLGSRGINPQFGAGLVDPLKALEQAVSEAPASQQDSLNRFLASPNASARVDDGFSALGYADDARMVDKAPPAAALPRPWLAWVDVRGTDFDRNTAGSDLKGTQVNAIAGLTRRLTPNFLVGVLGGYEHFDYISQAYNGVLRGDGGTAGAYLGWRFAPQLRFDAGAAWSEIFVDEAAGTATGNFTGQRWLVTGGVTGTYDWELVVLEPSARVYALWEHEDGYTDSLGTLQSDRNFETGRASTGAKVSYPLAWSSTVNFAPYAGLYGDYYFSWDDAVATGLTTVPLLEGWSARAIGGVAATLGGGAQISAGGEYAGIGGNTHIWTWRVRGMVPF